MDSFEIISKDLPFKTNSMYKKIDSIREGPKGRVFIECHSKAILELNPNTFQVKGIVCSNSQTS